MQILSTLPLIDHEVPGVLYEGERFIAIWMIDYFPPFSLIQNRDV
jgi:hypothetical protein